MVAKKFRPKRSELFVIKTVAKRKKLGDWLNLTFATEMVGNFVTESIAHFKININHYLTVPVGNFNI